MTEARWASAIFREKGVAYNQNDKRQLAAILPALEAAVHRVFPGAHRERRRAHRAARGVRSRGRACCLDPAGRLLWASPSATPLIARDGGGAPPAVVRAARELVASTRMGADASSAPRRVRFDGEGGASIWISLRLLRMSNGGLSVVAECSAALDPQALVDRLGVSRAEAAVLALLADGQANAAIATRLHVSTETVKTHVRNVLRKLGARSRVQAALIALGCLPPGADGTDGESAEDG
jgi:DNA-binding CsgD family transcriptional regulator